MTEIEMHIDTLEKLIPEIEMGMNLFSYDRSALQAALQALRRTADDDKAREEGLLVRLPCKVGDDIFTKRWNIKNQKYEVFAGTVKNVRYDAIDGSMMVSNGEYYREWGKDAFPSHQQAAAALDGGGEGD